MPYLYRCSKCGIYTLEDTLCPECGSQVRNPNPPKFSPVDKYGKYRREAKRKQKRDSK